MTSPHQFTGAMGEGTFQTYAASQGWECWRGVGNTSCDFVINHPDYIKPRKVEVKTATPTERTGRANNHTLAAQFDPKKFDHLFFVTPHGSYWIPVGDLSKSSIRIACDPDGVALNDKYKGYLV